MSQTLILLSQVTNVRYVTFSYLLLPEDTSSSLFHQLTRSPESNRLKP